MSVLAQPTESLNFSDRFEAPPFNDCTIAVFGAPSVDVYPKPEEIAPGHVQGSKTDWRLGVLIGNVMVDDATRYHDFLNNGAGKHLGGNGFNFLAGVAAERELSQRHNIRFVSVRGKDQASMMVKRALGAIGVTDYSSEVADYSMSASIIEIEGPGCNRMVLGKKRGAMGPHISDETIASAVDGAHIVALASPKDFSYMERVSNQVAIADNMRAAGDNTAPSIFYTVNPGSTDFGDPARLRDVLSRREPDVLALNDDEIQALHFGKISIYNQNKRVDIDNALRLANATFEQGLGKNVFLTLGCAGMILASEYGTYFHEAANVPQHLVVDNLGAGDSGHFNAAFEIYNNNRCAADHILGRVATGIESVLLFQGAHGHKEEALYPNGLSWSF